MAYIGKQPVVGNFVKLDAIVTSATATYNLLNGGVAYFPQTANNCIVSLNGVIQSPTSAYTISGSTIVFDSALTSADSIDFILVLGDVLAIGTPSDGTVTAAKLASGTAGLIAWQSIVTAATLTAVSGRGYWINTTSNACTVTLPASATAGDTIILVDYARKWGTNAVTINQNSLNFQGNTSPNPVYNTDGQSVTLVYSGATQGWIPTVDDDVTFETPQSYSIDFLVIAGGAGAGGSSLGGGSGGGGAGGFRTSTQTVTQGTAITVTVGDGGAGGSGAYATGGQGSNSSISGSGLTTITSAGGGAGGSNLAPNHPGLDGGSGGGAGGNDGNTPRGVGGAGNTPSTSPSQGNSGGSVVGASGYGAGGGGAGGSAPNSPGTTPQPGGIGSANSITGSSVTYSAGGGAGNFSPGSNGTANTGNGGQGSGGNNAGGSGGKGVVILSMLTTKYTGTTTGSPTVTTSGSNTILQFNGSGSYTA